MKIKEFIIIPSSIDAMGLVHKPGTGPNNRFGFKNHSNNKANENKIKLSTDPKYFGAVGVEKYNSDGLPTMNIPIKQLVGFEPEDKMSDPKSMAKVNQIAKAVQNKQPMPPILARKHKNGYQVIDGHHRFWGQKKAGANSIKAKIVPPQDIEEAAGVGIVTKQNATKDVPVGGEYMNIKKLHLGSGKPKKLST